MIKLSTLFLLILISLSLSSCKSDEQLEQSCAAVVEGLNYCFEQRSDASNCGKVVDKFSQKITPVPINDFNRPMWASNCKTLCLSTYKGATFMRDYYESTCVESEVITLSDDRLIKLLGMILLFLISSLILYFTIRSVRRVLKFRKEAIRAKGIVTGHDTVYRSGSNLYSPIIEFNDQLGSTQTLTSNTYSSTMNKPSDPVGSIVTVMYPKNQPEKARVDSFMKLWFVPFILFVIGGIPFLVAVNGLFSSRDWAVHHQYLKQHLPAVAGVANSAVHTIRSSALIFNSITGYRITDEKPDSITLELDYRLSPWINRNIYLGAISMTDGYSRGGWGYRPGKAHGRTGTAKVVLSLSSRGPDAYCSNEIELSMYYSGGPTVYERVIPYEKCWSRK